MSLEPFPWLSSCDWGLGLAIEHPQQLREAGHTLHFAPDERLVMTRRPETDAIPAGVSSPMSNGSTVWTAMPSSSTEPARRPHRSHAETRGAPEERMSAHD